MKPQLSQAQQELLAAVLGGEVERESDDVRAALRDPAFADALLTLGETAAAVDLTAHQERDALGAVEAFPNAPGSDRVESTLREQVAFANGAVGTSPLSARRDSIAPRLFALLTAAVALFLAYVAFRPSAEGELATAEELTLGNSGVSCVHPVGDTSTFDTFEWEAPEGGWTTLSVRSAIDGTKFIHVKRLTDTRWDSRTAVEEWPKSIRWEIRCYDGTGRFVGADESEARLKP